MCTYMRSVFNGTLPRRVHRAEGRAQEERAPARDALLREGLLQEGHVRQSRALRANEHLGPPRCQVEQQGVDSRSRKALSEWTTSLDLEASLCSERPSALPTQSTVRSS